FGSDSGVLTYSCQDFDNGGVVYTSSLNQSDCLRNDDGELLFQNGGGAACTNCFEQAGGVEDIDGAYALKLFHDNGDPGYTEKGRDLNRFRCELNAYKKLLTSGVCARGFVPKLYGYINRMDPAAFRPAFQHFAQDKLKPRAILLEYLPNSESLNCVNYSDALYPQAIEGMKEIHKAGVHHHDTYPRNLLLVRENPDRLVWIDFDVATTFTNFGCEQLSRCDYEVALVKGFGEALRDDQAEGLPPNTKFY
ncbi:serine/threonine protein kinase, partial [Penicillium samsonianum]|uniref:serine/threonine protein kinase n=1 Tax=Penicillium samsonianum TaxID=1882272 RepID=UPI0025499F66